jgi:ADP-dependent NAD(P)H-hydrate dehydratase / NAD(P)H-hydrate epimerase
MHVVTASEMRQMDEATITEFGLPGRVLMENAGRGAVRVLLKRFPALASLRVGVVAGRGNNGGDGFVIARYLAQRGVAVSAWLLARREAVRGDAAANLALLDPLGVPVTEVPDSAHFGQVRSGLHDRDLWVDAILGTGLTSQVRPFYQEVIGFINETKKPVFAVDIPSGLSSDTARPCGAAIHARVTATFGFPKLGHVLYPGIEYTGELEVIDIGIPPHIARQTAPRHILLSGEEICGRIPRRRADAHKGQTGHLLLLAGSPGKTGAAAMGAASAMRAGAGLVTLGVAQSLNAVMEAQVTEAMSAPLPEASCCPGVLGEKAQEPVLALLSGKKCLAVGPGIGTAEETCRLIQALVPRVTVPLVIDADGLNCLAACPGILDQCQAPVVLTPHPGEMARLMGATPAEIQADRPGCARQFAVSHGVHVVLKGARTLVAFPDGRVFINPTGNAGMAAGGMGDVLTGIISGLICQGASVADAALAGVYLHGAAADALYETIGPVGFLAGEVANAIPGRLAACRQGQSQDPLPVDF